MALLIDTSVLVDYDRGGAELERLAGAEERAISVVTTSELLQGVLRAPKPARRRREAAVERILELFEPLPVTEAVARVHAGLWADLVARGVVIDAHDLWIAATALTHDYGVATMNARDFERVPGLRVVTP